MSNTVKNGIDGNYKVVIRVFPDVIEVTAKAINHQMELMRSRSHGLRRPSQKNDFDFEYVPTDEELEIRRIKNEENKLRSLRRAKKSLRWQVQRFQADHMLTLTYRENMQDEVQLKKDFDQFRRYVQARYPKWSYVATKEKQGRGAFHLHLAVTGFQDINFLRTCWYRVLGCPNASKENTLGQVNIKKPRKQTGGRIKWQARGLSNYLGKYIAKDFDETEHASKRYWASRGAPKILEFKYWLSSSNITEMIKDALALAHKHGMTLMPNFWQSSDRTILTYYGSKIPIPF